MPIYGKWEELFRLVLVAQHLVSPQPESCSRRIPFTETLNPWVQAVSSGLQAISGRTPRDPVAAATVADAVRIVDSYIKVYHHKFLA